MKVNVIYDQTINKGQGLSTEQMDAFKKEQLAKAQKEFGTSNIQLQVTETYGRYDVGKDGVTPVITGLRSDSLNLVVSNGTPTNTAGVSYLDPSTRDPVSIVNINDAVSTNLFYPLVTNTTEHELVHQFLGDPYSQRVEGLWGNVQAFIREGVIDTVVKGQSLGISQGSLRQGLEPRRYAVPLNPEANKPKQ
ncbi:MAG: hypothetical protein B7X11_05765 [Acidobacteria bacterium 37-65-4]|nr:MAG: hypothetical protein B7X11_05765 [Acidobacteria bacterium 37-65-4]